MKKELIFIGSIDPRVNPGGETMKNSLMCEYFDTHEILVDRVDIEAIKASAGLVKLAQLAKLGASFVRRSPRKIVVSKSTRGAFLIFRLAAILNIHKKEIFYVVTGGSMVETIKTTSQVKFLKRAKKVFVQARAMQSELARMGVKNVVYLPNAKKIIEITPKPRLPGEVLRLVFLSRVIEQKGVTLLLDTLEELNAQKTIASLDIYGPFENAWYQQYVLERLAVSPYVRYKGILDFGDAKSYELLSGYDLFVFPTFWRGEGFPGVLLDAMMAHLPILASDWRYNREIVTEKIGYLVRAKDQNDLASCLIHIFHNREELEKKRARCFDGSLKYDSEVVFGRLVAEIFP